ncbi:MULTISPECIES: 2TM domain-containing protein [Cyanophyceae]|uniref:2TM domain-containing protein n=1 Tax=Cyanophyceae TaxID=3028117 RepID=UPI0016824B9D|nr:MULTISPECIES: 2TM domain-containing protein [Cyanophyceae]MBD1916074.1 2TM domain-containing protein [Phormidium sp. FACHB-77]MBD2031657.1 2TM domain-containing protein [Phormidium sp. FACHB-322]MBD2052716.1 2TM domain-containing protein [Leptolyngbya sp. FACHB-60]
MPPRWPRKPTREDPAYRKLEDRINFAVHVAAFTAVNSGLWFFNTLNPEWVPWANRVTLTWLPILVANAVYIFAIADYSSVPLASSADSDPNTEP